MQRSEKDKRPFVEITVLLMLDLRFSAAGTATALGVDDATLYRCADGYRVAGSLSDDLHDKYDAYDGRLTAKQEAELDKHLQQNLYRSTKEVAAWIAEYFGVSYTPTSAAALLKRLGFVYKKATSTPAKADENKIREAVRRSSRISDSPDQRCRRT